MHNKIKALLLTVTIVSTVSLSAFATPSDSRVNKQNEVIEQQKQQMQKNKDEMEKSRPLYEQAEAEVQKIQVEIEKLDNKISDMKTKIDTAQNKIDTTNENITKAQLELDKAEADMKSEEEIFGKRANNLYMNGTSSYIEVILDSEGLYDFISRIETLRAIAEHDNKIMTELKKKQADVDSRKKNLEQEKVALVDLKSQVEKDLQEVEKDKQKQVPLINAAQAKRDQYASTMQEFRDRMNANERQIQQAKNEIDRIRNEALISNTPSRGEGSLNIPSSGYGNAAVAIASKYLNVPYVWGGTTPSGFDCSGLVQYTYRQLGVSLPRTTYEQVKSGTAVSKSQLEPGDLVFFGSASSPHHVGIYVGNGCYIHAPRTGDVVKISSLSSRRDYCAGRRIR